MPITWAEFKPKVQRLLSQRVASDDLVVEAIAHYVQSHAALDLFNDKDRNQIHYQAWRSLRLDLAGYTYQGSGSINDLVRKRMAVSPYGSSDGGTNDVARVISYYVKAHIVTDLDQDNQLAGELMRKFELGRVRLLGHTSSLSDNDLKAEVRKYLPDDQDRENTDIFIDELTIQARKQIESLSDWIDLLIHQASEQIASRKTIIDESLLSGVIELQELIEAYREWNETIYVDDDKTIAEGFATRCEMPDNAFPKYGDILYEGTGVEGCGKVRVTQIPWEKASEQMICNSNCSAQIAFEPMGGSFYVTPQLESGISFSLIWSGIKTSYQDNESVPYGDKEARVVADYIRWRLSSYDKEAVSQQAQMRFQYEQGRRRLFLNRRRAKEFSHD